MADIIYPGQTPQQNLGATKLPSNVDLSFWRGDFQEYLIDMKHADGTAVDLTGKTAQAVIRKDFTSPEVYEFETTITNNQIRIYLSSAVSKTIPAGDYVWNLQLTTTETGDVRTFLAGDVKVYAEVDV